MPLGIVSDEELEKEIKGDMTVTPSRSLIIPTPKVGRKEEVPNIPDVIKKVIAEERINGASHQAITASFNVSQPTIASAAKGMASASANAGIDEELTNHVRTVKNRIIKKSSNKLMQALAQINPGRLAEASVRDASSIAKDMSQIIRNLEEPVDKQGKGNNAQFIFFAPQQKSLDQYDVITVDQ